MKRWIGTLACLGAFSATAMAQEPTPSKSPYHVTAKAGPWMVLAHSYKGRHAQYLADQLVGQLRGKYRLPAYTVNLELIKARWQGNNQEWVRLSQRGYQVKRTRQFEEWGIVIGGYKDEKDAKKALAYLRAHVAPPKLKDPNGRPAYDLITEWEEDLANGARLKKERIRNPYKNSFIIRNPTLPRAAQKAKQKHDPFWKQLNASEKYSLLKCSKKWTLAIKQFDGVAVMQEQSVAGSFLEKIGLTDNSRKLLNASALQAHELARFLRHYGMKAYVLHTRTNSIVTVGEFDKPNSAEMRRLQEQLGQLRFRGAQLPLNLFAQPLPMEVPQF